MPRRTKESEELTLVLGPEHQAQGQFDEGALTEQKMIGFSGEGSTINRLGPLYYWAWGCVHRPGATVPLHPHRGFEIFSYLLAGSLEHRDSLGHRSVLHAGGLQLMQTGSGLEHEEEFLNIPGAGLQIWLDPDFRRQIEEPPRFSTFSDTDFLRLDAKGAKLSNWDKSLTHRKLILGPQSPVVLQTPEVLMEDLWLAPQQRIERESLPLRAWSAIVLEGKGTWRVRGHERSMQRGDYLVLQTSAESHKSEIFSGEDGLHLVWIEVPVNPPYQLFPKPRGGKRS